jgi:hypothetical protein
MSNNRMMSGEPKRLEHSNLISNPQMMQLGGAQAAQNNISMMIPFQQNNINNRGKSLHGLNQHTTQQLMKNVINAGGNVFKGIINSQNDAAQNLLKTSTTIERNQY